MSDMDTFPTYEGWQHLKPDQRDYLLWDTLRSTRLTLNSMPDLYAKKQVEKIVYGFLTLVLIAFAGAIINLVIRRV